jgi:hypothetical protein
MVFEDNNYSKKGMEEEVADYLSQFDVNKDDIVYFCPAFDIEEFHDAMTELQNW